MPPGATVDGLQGPETGYEPHDRSLAMLEYDTSDRCHNECYRMGCRKCYTYDQHQWPWARVDCKANVGSALNGQRFEMTSKAVVL